MDEDLKQGMFSATRSPSPLKNSFAQPLTVTKAEAAYLETRSRILRGVLAPGVPVNQEALAASLGVSITPLREALRRLEMEGLVRLDAHRMVTTTPLTSRELDELYAIRTELEFICRRHGGEFRLG